MDKILISIAFTFFLGPGVGHLYLRSFKRGIGLITLTLIVAVHLAWQAAGSVPAAALTQQNPSLIFRNFIVSHSGMLTWYDLIFAAIWSFAFVDAYLIARALMPPPEEYPEEDRE
jgi:hypothetical protein